MGKKILNYYKHSYWQEYVVGILVHRTPSLDTPQIELLRSFPYFATQLRSLLSIGKYCWSPNISDTSEKQINHTNLDDLRQLPYNDNIYGFFQALLLHYLVGLPDQNNQITWNRKHWFQIKPYDIKQMKQLNIILNFNLFLYSPFIS